MVPHRGLGVGRTGVVGQGEEGEEPGASAAPGRVKGLDILAISYINGISIYFLSTT